MDRPSWTDTLRASVADCIPCLSCPAHSSSGADSDAENDTITNGQDPFYAIRRARGDEFEGLLAASGEDAGYNPTDDGDPTADADAISLHSHLGPRGRRKLGRKPPPKKPRHISFFGFDLFGAGRRVKLSEEGAEPLHRGARGTHCSDDTANGGRRSTDALLSNASPDAEALTDVSEADVERRARRKARKEMRRLAAEQEASVVPPAPSPNAHGGIPAVFLPPSPAPPPG
ncbi:hypothetical protein C8R43DRAFT_1240190 [Mycena crocata]|nr:hypothetical protein C8R43DRAFT_1240190 [Mycena crocata]